MGKRAIGIIGLLLAVGIIIGVIASAMMSASPTPSEKAILKAPEVLTILSSYGYNEGSGSLDKDNYEMHASVECEISHVNIQGPNETSYVRIGLFRYNSITDATSAYLDAKARTAEVAGTNITINSNNGSYVMELFSQTHSLPLIEGYWYTYYSIDNFDNVQYVAYLPVEDYLVEILVDHLHGAVDVTVLYKIAQAQYDKILSLSENQ